jgi:hypothetical protein
LKQKVLHSDKSDVQKQVRQKQNRNLMKSKIPNRFILIKEMHADSSVRILGGTGEISQIDLNHNHKLTLIKANFVIFLIKI